MPTITSAGPGIISAASEPLLTHRPAQAEFTLSRRAGEGAADRKSKTVRPTFLLIVLFCAAACAPQPAQPGTLLLSNPHFGPINVEAVITTNRDCGGRGPGYVSTLEFTLPTDATKFINVPPGADVCWRRDRDPEQPVAGEWSPWDRAYVAPGGQIDANL